MGEKNPHIFGVRSAVSKNSSYVKIDQTIDILCSLLYFQLYLNKVVKISANLLSEMSYWFLFLHELHKYHM